MQACFVIVGMKEPEEEHLLEQPRAEQFCIDARSICNLCFMTLIGLGIGCLFVAIRVSFAIKNI